ncbi:indolepyruvate ferredoxin oxidoreductase family protein [Actinomadura harenae]|uniref:Indolepyruvate ferredoxin oxidoreductase family protein n=1 Tax=Actinomadura harenae TaxID=2483351 RepID=A0A3M2LX24_9ACTN|nr:indolepyruvate ferredoxin oxidoreductase family protein [Actinomadura harenae]RMI41887.1 indolepyruvate ferredoxin oxidoreductase family protein [Actinomadura harenae]
MGVRLDDRYTAREGRVLISGVQALVRLTLEQRWLDEARGIGTRAFVSGYQGSPLGGVDLEMGRAAKFLDEAGVVFQAGLNEELAATAVAGTQLLGQVPGRRHEGVTGYWYGKNPGLDRAADAIRHAQLAGTAAVGGAVAWIGDDPASKSSTVPSSCEPMAQSLSLPLLAPGTVAEIIEFGLHAVALSRASGLWAGLKIVADIADASAVVDLEEIRRTIPMPVREERKAPTLVGPASLDAEHDMLTRRLDIARAYAREAGLNRITFGADNTTLGIVASGTQYAVIQRALTDLGLDEAAMNDLGLRLIRLGMPFPLDDAELVRMTADLDEVLVVEDKVPFLEQHLKAVLFDHANTPAARPAKADGANRADTTTDAGVGTETGTGTGTGEAIDSAADGTSLGGVRVPRVVGRRGVDGKELLPSRGTVGSEDVVRALVARFGEERLPKAAVVLRKPKKKGRLSLPVVAARTPYFCSGCPHNTSTRASEDTLVGVGIGCHVMIALDGAGRGNQLGLTQMGGEGTQWIGLAPFTKDKHFVQNLGDGTFHHSGSLAIRAAVAAGVTMTYKLLYNDAVAMTGGQKAEGRLDIPTLTRWLALEGVRRVVITTDSPADYRGVTLDPIAHVRHRDDLPEVDRELAALDGVTVLIHDDRCAAEERRLRKRGKLPTPAEKVLINERVCEGCGDCGEQSTCLSVQPVETEFGRKTRIHQPSCNTDLSCLKGDCPSFLLVEPGTRRQRSLPALPVALTEPVRRFGDADVLLRMPGIGGTGVVTVSQILQMAARLDGSYAAGLEQTGLAQKGGPVVSDLRFSVRPVPGALRATQGTADVLLGFDLLGAAAESNLATAEPGRTIAVVNTALVPTAAMVTGRVALPGSPDESLTRVESVTSRADNLYLDAQGLAETLFGDNMPANMVLVGAAYQHGCLPVAAEAIEDAIRLNGAAVDKNLAAFRWGRAAALDLKAVQAAVEPPARPLIELTPVARAIAEQAAPAQGGAELEEVLSLRVADLIEFQNENYARSYAEDVRRVTALAAERVDEDAARRVGLAYATSLHKLMAYKDEYEVARLHLDPVERAKREEEFGPDAKVSVMLHPPILRALGMKRKIRLTRTAPVAFRALRAARGLRGTTLDLFGHAEVRRIERELVQEYRGLVRDALTHLTPGTVAAVVDLARLPETVRGYEDIKLARVAEYRERAHATLADLAGANRTDRPHQLA